MSPSISIHLSLILCVIWALVFVVAAYSVPALRRLRPAVLILGLVLLAKDLLILSTAETVWLPETGSRFWLFNLYRVVMAVAGLSLLVFLFIRYDVLRGKASEEEVAEEDYLTQPRSALPELTNDDSLLSRFQHLMVEQRLFLRPQLTLPDVADILHTNKTYVSKVVNDNYKVSFPELINTLRVDYAEQFILNNREVRQEEVARACGFISASSFNNIFKKVTGMPPKQWVTSWDASHRN